MFIQDGADPPELRMLTRDDMLRGVPVPPRKFIVHAVGADDNDPYGAGLGRQLYWPDKKSMAETDRIVEGMGFAPDLDYIRSRYGDGWQIKAAPPPTIAPGLQFAEPGQDAIDTAIAEELDAWQPLLEPLAAPLEALFARARREGWTAGELLAALPGVLAGMDSAPLADSLGRLTLAARLAGEAGGLA